VVLSVLFVIGESLASVCMLVLEDVEFWSVLSGNEILQPNKKVRESFFVENAKWAH